MRSFIQDRSAFAPMPYEALFAEVPVAHRYRSVRPLRVVAIRPDAGVDSGHRAPWGSGLL